MKVLRGINTGALICCVALSVLLTQGCSSIKEAARGFIGISTKQLEESRGEALKREFSYPYEDCRGKTLKILKHIGAYVYSQDAGKKMIGLYVSEYDTTIVGIFFTEIDTDTTSVEISSPSTYAKELIAGKVFSYLENWNRFENETKANKQP